MGSVLSCFPCFPGHNEPESEPLLPQSDEHPDEHVLPRQETLNKIAQILAALSTGKLPTQEQLNDGLKMLLASDLLNDIDFSFTGDASRRPSPKLSHWGRVVLDDIRDVLQSVLELGAEKNYDDLFQDLLFNATKAEGQPIALDTSKLRQKTTNGTSKAFKDMNGQLPPTEDVRSDAQVILNSLGDILALVFTSTSFRIILTDIFVTAREVLADAIGQVGDAADTVAGGARAAENTIRPSDAEKQAEQPAEVISEPSKELQDTLKGQKEKVDSAEQNLGDAAREGASRARDAWDRLNEESPERIKETIVDRLSLIVQQVLENPQYRKSMSTILNIMRKYVEFSFQSASVVLDAAEGGTSSVAHEIRTSSNRDAINVDPSLTASLQDIRTLVERFAAGRSLDPVAEKAGKTIRDADAILKKSEADSSAEDASVQNFLKSSQEYCEHAASDVGWVSSEDAKTQLASIYDKLRQFLSGGTDEEARFRDDLRETVQQVEHVVEGFTKDRTTLRLISAIETLSTHVSYLLSLFKVDANRLIQREYQRSTTQIKRELRDDVLAFVMPRLLKAIRVVPLPRVEYKSPEVDLVLDNLNIEAVSFIPDRISVQNFNGMELLGSDARGWGASSSPRIVETNTRTRVTIEGLRVSTKDVAYSVEYRTPIWPIGWSDYGRLTIDVGGWRAVGEGLKIEVEVEFDASTSGRRHSHIPSDISATETALSEPPLSKTFKVLDVKVDAPRLKFVIMKSRHWITNSLCLQPILGPAVREALLLVVSRQIKLALEAAGGRVEGAAHSGDDGADFTSPSFWSTLIFGKEEHHEEPPSSPPLTSTSVTFKGVVRKSQDKASGEETMLAVGVGEQVLPDVHLPSPTREVTDQHARNVEEAEAVLVSEGREALDDLQKATVEVVDQVADNVVDAAQTAVDARERVREEFRVAQEEGDMARQEEMSRGGWKSDAFSLQ